MAIKVTSTAIYHKENIGRLTDFVKSLSFADVSAVYPSATEEEFLNVQTKFINTYEDFQTPGNTLGIPGYHGITIEESAPDRRVATYLFDDQAAFDAYITWWQNNSIDGSATWLHERENFNVADFIENERPPKSAPSLAICIESMFHLAAGTEMSCIHETI